MPKIISCEGMDGLRDDTDLAITVLTCEGDLKDPAFPNRLRQIVCKLKTLVSDEKKPFQVCKVEPWNSVRVTFNIPRYAAQRLRHLAETGDTTLRDLGILSVQIEGDQVITLTLANNYNERSGELLIAKVNERSNSGEIINASSVNSSTINDLTLTYNHHVNNSVLPVLPLSTSVSSVVSSNVDFISSSTCGSSVDITRKNIAQYLSQQHSDVVTNINTNANSDVHLTTSASCATSATITSNTNTSNSDLVTFRSPNVVAPVNNEPIPPIPYRNSNANPTVTSTCAASVPNICSTSSNTGSLRLPVSVSSSVSVPNASKRDVQSNYGLFPFASMQHAMHTKQGLNTLHYNAGQQRPNQVISSASVRALSSTFCQSSSINPSLTNTITTISVSPAITTSSLSQSFNRDAKNIKISQIPIPTKITTTAAAPQPQQQQQLQQQQQQALSQTSQNVSLVSTTVNQSCANATLNSNGVSANVALTSPLLVNLLQSDATVTAHHLKAMPPPNSNQNTTNTDLVQKKKQRKTRKPKEKIDPENADNSSTQSISITPTNNQAIKHLPSTPFPSQSTAESKPSLQQSFTLPQHLISIPIGSMPRFASIHPEAQGQPQVVRAGHIPLRSQLSRPQVSVPIVGSPGIVTTHLRNPLYVSTANQVVCKPVMTANANTTQTQTEEKSSLNASAAPIVKPSLVDKDKSAESTSVFPSPPISRISKTKHLINPFTGHLEPMLSDDEEEERPSSECLFPELDAGSDIGGNSERSLSDAGSNGKENNHSSDTDSGLGKSGTDVSQSSNDNGNGNTPTHTSESTCVAANNSLSSNDSSDKVKLRLKVEPKECSISDNFPSSSLLSNSLYKSHLAKQKSTEPSLALSTSTVIAENQILATEPRVPPLHISIRGPNSAVVVSNRRESMSEIEMKTVAPKKMSRMRTTRALSAESTLVNECTVQYKNQRKKLQREQRFLSGGGIVTSNLSLCASPSVESLVDINTNVNDSLPLGNKHLSEANETVFFQSSDDCSYAQNKLNDNNISTDKIVPHNNNEHNNEHINNECAIYDPLENTSTEHNKDIDFVNISISTPDSASSGLVSSAISDDSDSYNEKSETKHLDVTSSINQNTTKIAQNCHNNNNVIDNDTDVDNKEATLSTEIIAPDIYNVELTKNKSKTDIFIERESSENYLNNLPVATVVTVEPLIDANTENVSNKVAARMNFLNCVSTAIPALVNTRDLDSLRPNLFHTNKPNSPLNSSFNDGFLENDCEDIVTVNENTQTKSKLIFTAENLDNTCKISKACAAPSPSESTAKFKFQTSNLSNVIVLNGDLQNENKGLNDVNKDSNASHHSTSISFLIKKDDQTNNDHDSKDESIISHKDDDNENKSEDLNLKIDEFNENACIVEELNSDIKTSSTCESTANLVECNDKSNTNHTVVEELKNNDNEELKEKKDMELISSSSSSSIQSVIQKSIVTNITNLVKSDEITKPLQIVITTTVPSFTTTTSTNMFSQLKSSSLESGSRVTLITFKPNLSPNTSSSNIGKVSDLTNCSLTNTIPSKSVPFKLLTIPPGSGGITVRSAANKLVELINSTAGPTVSSLSPNTLPSGGSPLPLNSTSPPVRLLVSKVATATGVSQAGVPVSVSGNSIGQLVVVKSVMVTNPSPSIKFVPAKSPSINSSLLIPFTRTNSPEHSFTAVNINNNINNHNITDETSDLSSNKELSDNASLNENSNSETEMQNQDSNSTDIEFSQLEPVDLTVQYQEDSLITSDDTKNSDNMCDAIPKLIRSSDINEDSHSDVDDLIDDKLHSVASDHNYILRNSNDSDDIDDTVLNLSNTNEMIDSLKNHDILDLDDTYSLVKMPELHTSQGHKNTIQYQAQQCQDIQSRPNKRKCSENAAELIKACMGLEDAPKRNSYSSSFPITSGIAPRVQNIARTRAASLDNDGVAPNDSSTNETILYPNKTKNLRVRKGKVASDSSFVRDTQCLSGDELDIKDDTNMWNNNNKPRLRTPSSISKTQRIKQRNCKDTNKEKLMNRSNEKAKKGRDRDQVNRSLNQRSTRRSRDHNIMISGGINIHSSESTSEPLHMEIVGLELSNDSNNFNCDSSVASTAAPIIASSLLVKRKTRVGLNNTESTDAVVTKRRRPVKETHR